jgi:hypothetical protein
VQRPIEPFSIVRDREHSRHVNPDREKAVRNCRRIGIDNFAGGELVPGAQNDRPYNHIISRPRIRKYLLDVKKANNNEAERGISLRKTANPWLRRWQTLREPELAK